MIFGNPVPDKIFLTESGTRFYRSQRYGCGTEATGISNYEQALGSCGHFHRAIDVAPSDGRSGVNLIAMARGRVFAAGELNDGAKVIGIYHGGGIVTGYAHNAVNLVGVGQEVAKGFHIAEMGKTGKLVTGIHCHVIAKADFVPSGNALADLNDLILDDPKYGFSGIEPGKAHGTGRGTWLDSWIRLEQNVRIHPKAADGINLRTAMDLTAGSIYAATTADGRIRRHSDNVDLGASPMWRSWGGIFTGPTYTASGASSNRWERIWVVDRWLYIASLLATRSVS